MRVWRTNAELIVTPVLALLVCWATDAAWWALLLFGLLVMLDAANRYLSHKIRRLEAELRSVQTALDASNGGAADVAGSADGVVSGEVVYLSRVRARGMRSINPRPDHPGGDAA